jgi:hypothetical protein
VVTLDNGKLTVESCRLHPIDDTIAGDRAIAGEIEKLKKDGDHLRSLPGTKAGRLPVIPVDGRAADVRAIKVG